MGRIWVTGCSHFNHRNICGPQLSTWESGFRNFSSLEEMNDCIIENYNSVINQNDELYHLGDFAFGDKSKIPYLRNRIRCRNIHFIYGNHDRAIKKVKHYHQLFSTVRDYKEIRHNKVLVSLFHFPIASWNDMENGAISLHSHTHGTWPRVGRRMDVGVDPQSFHPVLLDEVIEELTSFPIDFPRNWGSE